MNTNDVLEDPRFDHKADCGDLGIEHGIRCCLTDCNLHTTCYDFARASKQVSVTEEECKAYVHAVMEYLKDNRAAGAATGGAARPVIEPKSGREALMHIRGATDDPKAKTRVGGFAPSTSAGLLPPTQLRGESSTMAKL